MRLIVENLRSFAGHHSIAIKPLTILVGENSTGKSTFLAALSAVSDAESFPGAPALNKPPYDLGSFENIATYKGGKAGRAKRFGLGFSVNEDQARVEVIAHYTPIQGETRLCGFDLQTPEGAVTLQWRDGRLEGSITGIEGVDKLTINQEVREPANVLTSSLPLILIRSITDQIREAAGHDIIQKIFAITGKLDQSISPSASIAPIRSTPKRTYDLISEEYDPSGDHIPFVLARLLDEAERNKTAYSVLTLLNEFGVQSGLFKKLKAKRLGSRPSSPFQIQVNVSGPSFNLTDVGYGVSQSLPIIVQSVLKSSSSRLLLQQPEVHLHPRAQAAMGSFFARLVAAKHKEFVIETHSDYLVDRVRVEVAGGRIKAEDVLILFFERPHIETKVHEMTLDINGNILNAPSTYRAFFLREEMDLLNRTNLCV